MNRIIDFFKRAFFCLLIYTDLLEKYSQYRVLKLFTVAYKNVPAYKAFLNRNNFYKSTLGNIAHFKSVPITNKYNYLNSYGIFDRTKSNKFYEAHSLEGSSGYSGRPTFILREPREDYVTKSQFENLLNQVAKLNQVKTLFINCYAFGLWPSGEKVSRLLKEIAYNKKNKLLVVNPGPDSELTLEIIEVFCKYFDHLILAGYPPFIKTLADRINERGLQTKIKISVNTGGEGFPEKFREYLAKKLNININAFGIPTILSNYGITEFGNGTGFETYLSIQIRRMCQTNKSLAKDVFGKYFEAEPMLLQYNPLNFFAEVVNNEIIATTNSLSPLLRYNIYDIGGIISYKAMTRLLKKHSLNVSKITRKSNFGSRLLFKLPFIFVAGRSDGAITFRGANLYLENIKNALMDPTVADLHTNYFTVEKLFDDQLNPLINICIELKTGVMGNLQNQKLFEDIILKSLGINNREFRDAASHISYSPIKVSFVTVKDKESIKNKYIVKTGIKNG